jgi:filamentous hemagglutinin
LLEEKVLNILVSAVTGFGETMVTKEGLKAAAEQMREVMIADSTTFKGVVDSTGKVVLSNASGTSEGINGDGFKLGGTRLDLDKLCGPDNARCTFEKKADGSIDTSKPVQFKGDLQSFLDSPEGQKMAGATGGVQGAEGSLFKGTFMGSTYTAGSWQDKLIESFAGTHDFAGGKLSGLYDDQGNATRGRSAIVSGAQEERCNCGVYTICSCTRFTA